MAHQVNDPCPSCMKDTLQLNSIHNYLYCPSCRRVIEVLPRVSKYACQSSQGDIVEVEQKDESPMKDLFCISPWLSKINHIPLEETEIVVKPEIPTEEVTKILDACFANTSIQGYPLYLVVGGWNIDRGLVSPEKDAYGDYIITTEARTSSTKPNPQLPSSDNIKFSTGAARGHNSIPYHFLHPAALMSVGVASAEGAAKYSPYNNLKGFPLSTLYDHAFEHLLKFWWMRDPTEDDLGHAIWNLNQIVMQLSDPETYSSLDDRPTTKTLTQEAIDAFTKQANSFHK